MHSYTAAHHDNATMNSLHFAMQGVEKHYIGLRCLPASTSDTQTHATLLNMSRELPMPNVSKISSLNQAEATLLHCWTKLARVASASTPTSSELSSQPSSPVADRQHYQKWMEQWELAFTTFLTNAMASMSNEDITQSRILKANHLACTILAADDQPSFDAFEAEFRAIIELVDTVLRSRYHGDSPREPRSTESSPVSAVLDVKDPLYVVLSHCNKETIRSRAAELLLRFNSERRM